MHAPGRVKGSKAHSSNRRPLASLSWPSKAKTLKKSKFCRNALSEKSPPTCLNSPSTQIMQTELLRSLSQAWVKNRPETSRPERLRPRNPPKSLLALCLRVRSKHKPKKSSKLKTPKSSSAAPLTARQKPSKSLESAVFRSWETSTVTLSTRTRTKAKLR